MPDFHVRVANDDLVFSAAHFITFEGGACERLHGHTYRTAAEVSGPLNQSQYVVDFLALQAALRTIVAELDHRTLLPADHPALRVSAVGDQIEAVFGDRRWTFPQDDCLVLPMPNTTSERLAQYIAGRLQAALAGLGASVARLRVEIDQCAGARAVCALH